jgi:exopolyphosphatase/guanosine-5'-triphosphate,3'-diphosphate pyrophosphatase
MLIAEVLDGRIVRRLFQQRGITRLGAGLSTTGELSTASMDKTIELFHEFSIKIKEHNVEQIFAAATSAVREAKNASVLLERAHAAGIPLETISGKQEAEYTCLGIASSSSNLPSSMVIYDIGGGSTEFTYVYGNNSPQGSVIPASISISIGVVKLSDKYGFDKPTDAVVHARCIADIRKQLLDARLDMEKSFATTAVGIQEATGCIDSDYRLMGTAGSVTTIAAVELALAKYDPERVNQHILTQDRIATLLARLSPLTIDERLKFVGLEAGRADLMIPGMLMVLAIMDIFGQDTSLVSDYGLREGLAIAASNRSNGAQC